MAERLLLAKDSQKPTIFDQKYNSCTLSADRMGKMTDHSSCQSVTFMLRV
jgi:hypothetical protein